MGALREFIVSEFLGGAKEPEKNSRVPAIIAIPAISAQKNSDNSDNSENSIGKRFKSAHWCNCGEPAAVAFGWFLRDQNHARWYCTACLPSRGAS